MEERLAEQTEDVLLEQLSGSLEGLSPEQMAGTVLAYEPVWAIGTGLTATPGAGPGGPCIHPGLARQDVRRGDRRPGRRPVRRQRQARQRGGATLLPDIDGALVGGASLKASDFLAIIRAGQEVTSRGKP